MHTNNKAKTHLPFTFYYWMICAVALVGLLDSIYLAISHYRVHMDVAYMSFCAISKSLNCDTVSQSQYAIFIKVPVAVWGTVGYGLILSLLILCKKQQPAGQRIWPIIFIISGIFSCISIILALISSIWIKSYCLMCILSFGVNFLIFYLTWMVRTRFDQSRIVNALKREGRYWKDRPIPGALIAFTFLITCLLLILYYPKYWDYTILRTADMQTGVTEDGHPWIGAVDPIYTITEFTDYQCFQCRKMQSHLRLVVAKNPKKIRLVHRHFPMDHTINPIVKKPYHVGSGKMALLAIFAASKGKFWEMNDLLFKIARDQSTTSIKEILNKVGLDLSTLKDPEIESNLIKKLTNDINDGIDLGFVGTPGYLIDGKVYSGSIPKEIIKKISQVE